MSYDYDRRLAGGYYRLQPGTPLTEVLRRWVEEGEKVYDDSMPVLFSARDVWPHREYTWTRETARDGQAVVDGKRVELEGPLKWDAMVLDMKRRGWDPKEPLHLKVGKNGKLLVGEGNHRLAIAMQVGLAKVPVWLHFEQRVGKAPKREPVPKLPRKVVEEAVRKEVPSDEEVDDLLDLLGL